MTEDGKKQGQLASVEFPLFFKAGSPDAVWGLGQGGFYYLDLLGKEFQYGGRGPDAYDCYGLMIECRRRLGLFIPENYVSTDIPEAIQDCLEDAKRVFPFIEVPEPRPFCFAAFRINPRYTTHIAMVLEDGVRFIHILPKLRVAVERLDSPVWAHRIMGYWEVNP